jgi:hypothetical protein
MEVLEQLPERVTALEAQIEQLRDEIRSEFSATRSDLRVEIRTGDEETRRYMRVLHEDLVGRIAALREGL